jgi:hypothetical protein
MSRWLMTGILVAAMTAGLNAQQASSTDSYEGVSHPPADDTIVTTTAPEIKIAKPSAAHRAGADAVSGAGQTQAATPTTASVTRMSTATTPAQVDGTDAGLVVVGQAAPPAAKQAEPQLMERATATDPDSDIVHPAPLPPDVLGEGTSIRVRLTQDLSSNFSEAGQAFSSTVATDVISGDQVLIPAGSEINGTVVHASAGHFASYGSLQLRPEMVKLPSGKVYRLDATVTGAPVSKNMVHAEGMVGPGSQVRRDSIEYGGAVGTGAVAGAYLGGPMGALAGGLIGAGLVTAHLLVSHPQATLDAGTPLILTLNENMRLAATEPQQN